VTLYPDGYGTAEVTLEQLKAKHGPKMHPEFARRLFAWIEVRGGFVGIGGGWRAVQPVKPGFAPPGKSFHESQTFASGLVVYAAVDLVVRQPGQKHRAPTWAETDDARPFGLHTFVTGEPWHMQCVEMRGYQTWVNAGRPDPARIDLPGEIPPSPPPLQEDDDMPVCFVTDTKLRGTFALCSGRWVPWLFPVPDGVPHFTGDHAWTREQILDHQGPNAASLWRERMKTT
jgi:hypothetical protein